MNTDKIKGESPNFRELAWSVYKHLSKYRELLSDPRMKRLYNTVREITLSFYMEHFPDASLSEIDNYIDMLSRVENKYDDRRFILTEEIIFLFLNG